VVDDLASVKPWRPRFLEIRGHAEAIAEPTDSAYGADEPCPGPPQNPPTVLVFSWRASWDR
jgi:hypothetical protein